MPALAKAIAQWFPDLGGRALAVSDMDTVPKNPPTLPICLVALDTETVEKGTAQQRPTIIENIVVEFWFEPNRYKRDDGTETPFFTFYNYSKLRNRLLTPLLVWMAPDGSRFKYRGLIVQVTEYAAIVTLKFEHSFVFCADAEDAPDCQTVGEYVDGQPFTITVTQVVPSNCCEEECEPESADCPSAQDNHEWKG